jgi:hypothetical protein
VKLLQKILYAPDGYCDGQLVGEYGTGNIRMVQAVSII